MSQRLLVGQLCDVIDLDGPTFLEPDREITVDYSGREQARVNSDIRRCWIVS